MVEDKINQWILENYGEIVSSGKQNIAKTFELYWDQFNFRYAEIKTLEKYPPPPPFFFKLNTNKNLR
jgi:hypothetical protein